MVIAAHEEENVIGSCLRALASPGEPLDVVVVANGCTDATAAVARSHGARVVDLAEPGKANALNHGDAVSAAFPRLYLDADIVLPAQGVRLLADALAMDPDLEAVVPRRRLETAGRPLVVRCWAAINQRLPVYDTALFGRGAIMLSSRGRSRFDRFPGLQADDLFLDGVVPGDRRLVVQEVEVVVQTPYRERDLMRRLIRVRRANAELRATSRSGSTPARSADRTSWLRSVVLRKPWLLPAGAVYAALNLAAAWGASRTAGGASWGRDESTRRGVARPESLP